MSRRQAEEALKQGRVYINGTLASVGQSGDINEDKIEVDGLPLTIKREPVYLILNKPKGYVTTMSDEHERKAVAELVEDVGERVYPVGRLDMYSEGLLLMTNDGELANKLMHPRYGVEKTYTVWVSGDDIAGSALKLSGDMELDGRKLNRAEVKVLSIDGKNGKLNVTISEGRNRQVRRMCAQVDLTVRRLVRISEGKLQLGNLAGGKWRKLTESEIEYIHSVKVR